MVVTASAELDSEDPDEDEDVSFEALPVEDAEEEPCSLVPDDVDEEPLEPLSVLAVDDSPEPEDPELEEPAELVPSLVEVLAGVELVVLDFFAELAALAVFFVCATDFAALLDFRTLATTAACLTAARRFSLALSAGSWPDANCT